MDAAHESRETIQKSFQEAHVDILSTGDLVFERAKAQALGLHPRLNVSEMDFFKIVMDGRLVNMVENESSLDSDVSKDGTVGEESLEIHEEEKNED